MVTNHNETTRKEGQSRPKCAAGASAAYTTSIYLESRLLSSLLVAQPLSLQRDKVLQGCQSALATHWPYASASLVLVSQSRLRPAMTYEALQA